MLSPTIVYDLDGTLADTAEDLVATLNWLLGREGLAPIKVESAGSLVGAGARALIKRGFAASGRTLDPQEVEALFADYLSYYNAHIVDHTRLYPGVDKALAAFARAGWRQAVCTNKIEGSAKLLIAKLGIAERFAFICGQDTFGVGKPDAEAPPHDHRRFGRREGTRDHGRRFGHRHQDRPRGGVPSIAVDFGYTDVPVQELGPDRVISHFDRADGRPATRCWDALASELNFWPRELGVECRRRSSRANNRVVTSRAIDAPFRMSDAQSRVPRADLRHRD